MKRSCFLITIMLLSSVIVAQAFAVEPVKKAVKDDVAKKAATEAIKSGEKLPPVAPVKPEEKKLLAISDNTVAMLQRWLADPQEVPSGFACPKCDKEMLRNVRILLNTSPAMSILRCPDEKCKFTTAVF